MITINSPSTLPTYIPQPSIERQEVEKYDAKIVQSSNEIRVAVVPKQPNTPTQTATVPFQPTAPVPVPTETIIAQISAPTATPTAIVAPTLVPTSTPEPRQTLGAALHAADGDIVKVAAEIVYTSSFSHGFKYTLWDETATGVVLLLWHDMYDVIMEVERLNVGAQIVLEGRVSRYGDEVQIVPLSAEALTIQRPAWPWAQPHTTANAGDSLGRRIQLTGVISDRYTSDSINRLTLVDTAGELDVIIWPSIWQRLQIADQLAVGQTIQVVGVADTYQNSPQLVVQLPADVSITQP